MKIEFAILDSNMLSCMGMQRLLEGIIPMVDISLFNTYEQFVMAQPERFIHCFVSSAIYFEHAQYFIRQPKRYIVMVHGDAYPHIAGLLTLNVSQDEKSMVKQLLMLQQRGRVAAMKMHSGMDTPEGTKGMPNMHPLEEGQKKEAIEISKPALLSARETEVAVLLAKGYINKEVAERMNISLTTVITHRKNIMDKLHGRSLADIIIYVVMNGIIGADEL